MHTDMAKEEPMCHSLLPFSAFTFTEQSKSKSDPLMNHILFPNLYGTFWQMHVISRAGLVTLVSRYRDQFTSTPW